MLNIVYGDTAIFQQYVYIEYRQIDIQAFNVQIEITMSGHNHYYVLNVMYI